jgi:DNA (cytosine-5)-methyltransferase 1
VSIGSLCSGYGGLEMGLQSAIGGNVAWHAEYDPDASKILAYHWPDVPNYGDITTTDWASLPRVDWLTAGYPCQPFSLAGKRKGTDDIRHLWPFVAGAIRVLRPGHVLLENVASHVSLGLDAVLADLASLGYVGRWGVLRAADAGAPHGRARLFIVATDTDCLGHERGGGAWGRRAGFANHSLAAPDADEQGWEGCEPAQGRHLPSRGATPDAAGDGRDEGRPEPTGIIGGPDAAVRGDAAADAQGDQGWLSDGDGLSPADADSAGRSGLQELHGAAPGRVHGSSRGHLDGCDDGPDWGPYKAAIREWERVLGRPAPRPTELGRRGQRLSPAFVEFLMGLPSGHVTAVPGLSRNAQLKALGNGVVPQQCALALRMLGVERAVAA